MAEAKDFITHGTAILRSSLFQSISLAFPSPWEQPAGAHVDTKHIVDHSSKNLSLKNLIIFIMPCKQRCLIFVPKGNITFIIQYSGKPALCRHYLFLPSLFTSKASLKSKFETQGQLLSAFACKKCRSPRNPWMIVSQLSSGPYIGISLDRHLNIG